MGANHKKRLGLAIVRSAEPEILWRCCQRNEPGRYHAWTRSASIYYDRRFKSSVCAVQFDVLDDSRARVVAELTVFLNLGSKDNMRVARRMQYRRAVILVNGGAPKR